MSIQNIMFDTVGSVSVNPRFVKIECNDSFATITSTGYLDSAVTMGFSFTPKDVFNISYENNAFAQFVPTFSGTQITLNPANAGEVMLPVTANHIAVYADADGVLTQSASPAINVGNIQAGISGTSGNFTSFPSTASKGNLRLQAVANTGNTTTVISNAVMGQASTISIPDPAAATANFAVAPAALVNNNLIKSSGTVGLVADSGIAVSNVQLKTQVLAGTVVVPAVAATFNFTVTGLTSSSVVAVNFQSQTNPASILTAAAGTNVITIVATANPGNSVMQYVAYIVGQ